jgi:hypothetical protein
MFIKGYLFLRFQGFIYKRQLTNYKQTTLRKVLK